MPSFIYDPAFLIIAAAVCSALLVKLKFYAREQRSREYFMSEFRKSVDYICANSDKFDDWSMAIMHEMSHNIYNKRLLQWYVNSFASRSVESPKAVTDMLDKLEKESKDKFLEATFYFIMALSYTDSKLGWKLRKIISVHSKEEVLQPQVIAEHFDPQLQAA